MALPGSHIRFALELENGYPIGNRSHYLSGTVYPDSRWLTGIHRDKTHGEACLKKDFPHSDFTCGWQVHCLCDAVQQPIYERLLPDGKGFAGDDRWVRHAAAKMIQDLRDSSRIDLKGSFAALDYTETPCGEAVERVLQFNAAVQKAYTGPKGVSLETYHALWLDIGLSPGLAARVIARARTMLADPALVRRIEKAYGEMIRSAVARRPASP